MNRSDALTLSLLDYLSHRAGCEYLSDLPYTTGWQRTRLTRALEDIPPEAASLHDWNDALQYLARQPPEETAQGARERLIQSLSRPRKGAKIRSKEEGEART